MMAGLFLLFLITMILVGFRLQRTALILGIITIILCFVMLLNHATNTLKIEL